MLEKPGQYVAEFSLVKMRSKSFPIKGLLHLVLTHNHHSVLNRLKIDFWLDGVLDWTFRLVRLAPISLWQSTLKFRFSLKNNLRFDSLRSQKVFVDHFREFNTVGILWWTIFCGPLARNSLTAWLFYYAYGFYKSESFQCVVYWSRSMSRDWSIPIAMIWGSDSTTSNKLSCLLDGSSRA